MHLGLGFFDLAAVAFDRAFVHIASQDGRDVCVLIAEPYVPELDLAVEMIDLNGVFRILHLRLHVHDREDLLRRRKGRLKAVEHVRQVLDRIEEGVDVHVEGHQHAGSDRFSKKRGVLNVTLAAEIQKHQDRGNIEHVDQRPEDREDEQFVPHRLVKPLVLLAEFPEFLLFVVEDLRDLDAGQVLRQEGVHVRRAVLDFPVGSSGEFPEHKREEHDEGGKGQHQKRQRPVQEQHRHDDADDHEDIFQKVHENVREEHRDGVRVVGLTCHKLADRNVVQLACAEGFDVEEQVLSDRGQDLLPDLLEHDGLKVHGAQRGQHDHDVDSYAPEDFPEFEGAFDDLFDVADDERRNNVEHGRHDHQEEDHDVFLPVRLCVSEKTPDELRILHVAVETDLLFLAADREVRKEEGCGKKP